jgi:hypothetical protein
VPLAQSSKLVELTGIAVDVDGDDCSRPLRDRTLDRRRREVQRPRVDVREDRRRALVHGAVRGGDERVRRGDHLVPGADSGDDAEQVEAGGSARDGRRVRRPDDLGERLLEAVDRRPEREPARAEDVRDELLLALVEPRGGEVDRPDGRHAYATDGVSSTTSR